MNFRKSPHLCLSSVVSRDAKRELVCLPQNRQEAHFGISVPILMHCLFQILEGTSPYFGYSIAGNMDLDRNSYPDVAVGSLSDTVTIFRCVVSALCMCSYQITLIF